MPNPFPEIREADASGEIADIYYQLRMGLGLPIVNLIYRHFATVPGALQFVWSRLREPALNGSLDRARARVAATPVIGAALQFDIARLRKTPANAADRAEILAVSEFYNRGNLMNLIGLTAIRMLLDDPPAKEAIMPAVAVRAPDKLVVAIRPLLKISELPAGTAALVRSLAAHHSGAGSGVTPSLYLHLAYWPEFVAALAEGLAPAFADGSFARAGETTRRLAESEAAALLPSMMRGPAPPDDVAAALAPPIGLFTGSIIPEMIPIGLAICHALRADEGAEPLERRQ